ncbi:MAG: cation-translocating P-type ATPase [Bacteroidetes bacterium]|nr:cation-translocating P-type ATPase [Bacteroidota bacterium]
MCFPPCPVSKHFLNFHLSTTLNCASMAKGLSAAEASEKLKTHGYNELPSSRPKSILRIAWEVMKEPMFLLLISCAVLYMVLGDYKEGSMLLSSILIIIFITFYQYQKTEKALDALKKLSAPRALVIRDGQEVRIAGREIVPGDLIIVNEGDRIPADARLEEATNLTIDESLLTGESLPISKSVSPAAQDAHGLVYSGTLVVQGRGLAAVFATGQDTQFGQIGKSLESIEQDTTRLQKEMSVLIRNLFIIGAVISLGVVAAFYFTRGDLLHSLLSGLAAAMAILPEEFPVVLTVFLALGAWRLSRQNVLTRKPSAIETLGSATVLCSDKTGTITQNRMEVAALYDGQAMVLREAFMQQSAIRVLACAFYASPQNSVDPMEQAFRRAFEQFTPEHAASDLVREYPFSRQLLAMTRVLRGADGCHAYCKGAPEEVFRLCHMTDAAAAQLLAVVRQMAEKGYRVIAAASCDVLSDALPDTQPGFGFTFVGLLGLADPVRPEVPQAVRECQEAGIKVVMITGDFPATAKSIASQAGIDTGGEVLSGDELKAMTDAELQARISRVNIFARVVPDQKLRIVKAFMANNEIVAMTGDGVNDAPALKAADIGIAMGSRGTDVAREASSLVLLDDNFASIVAAIRLGRRIFDNLQKAMSYVMAIHIPIIGLALLPAFFTSLPLLLMPLHIVFMELIIDPVSSVAFETEPEEKGIMSRPPRNPAERFFGWRRIAASILRGLLLLAAVMTVYFLSIREGHSDGEVRAIAFSSLIIGNVFLILTSLSRTRSFVSVILERNIAALSIMAVALTMLALVTLVPALERLFSFDYPGFRHFAISIAAASAMLLLLEIVKLIRYRLGKSNS